MYYGHMSKDDIMHSSRLFLTGIYRQYINRAKENLGVSDKNADEETENDYPTEFFKLPMKDREETLKEFSGTEDFMRIFGESSKYDNDMFKKLDEQKGET